MRVLRNEVRSGGSQTITSRAYGGMPYTWSQQLRLVSYDRLEKADIVKATKDASGWRQPLPYSVNRYKYQCFSGRVQFYSGSPPSLNSWNLVDGPLSGVSVGLARVATSASEFPRWLVERAETKALIKLKNQNVNYALAIAEATKSMGLIGENVMRIYNAYSAAKRGRWKRAATALGLPRHRFRAGSKDVAKRWLELQYGWLPLLSDVYNAYEEARDASQWAPRLAVTQSVKRSLDEDRETTLNGRGNDGTIRSYVFKRRGFQVCKVRLDYEVLNPELALKSKVGITNPATVLWELVPFSFVVDWMVPIGEWISSWDASFGLRFKGGSQTRFSRETLETHPTFNKWSVASHGTIYPQTEVWESLTREVYTNTPWPLPYFKNPVSTGHALNALALLRGLFK